MTPIENGHHEALHEQAEEAFLGRGREAGDLRPGVDARDSGMSVAAAERHNTLDSQAGSGVLAVKPDHLRDVGLMELSNDKPLDRSDDRDKLGFGKIAARLATVFLENDLSQGQALSHKSVAGVHVVHPA